MALRLLRYCCRIWEADRHTHPKERFLRPVLPLVFYQGKRRWRYATELAESFPPALRDQPWVPRFRHLLLDQTQVAPAAVAGALRGRLLQLAMMHTFEQELGEARERIAPLLAALQREPARGGVDYYRAFMEYIVKTGPADTLDELMPRMAPELRGDLMSLWRDAAPGRPAGRRVEGPPKGPDGGHRRAPAGGGRVAGDPIRHRHRRADLPHLQARRLPRDGAARAVVIPRGIRRENAC